MAVLCNKNGWVEFFMQSFYDNRSSSFGCIILCHLSAREAKKGKTSQTNRVNPSVVQASSVVRCCCMLHGNEVLHQPKMEKKVRGDKLLNFWTTIHFRIRCASFFFLQKKSKLEDKAKRLLAPAVISMRFFREKEEVIRKCEVFLCQHIDKSSSQKKRSILHPMLLQEYSAKKDHTWPMISRGDGVTTIL